MIGEAGLLLADALCCDLLALGLSSLALLRGDARRALVFAVSFKTDLDRRSLCLRARSYGCCLAPAFACLLLGSASCSSSTRPAACSQLPSPAGSLLLLLLNSLPPPSAPEAVLYPVAFRGDDIASFSIEFWSGEWIGGDYGALCLSSLLSSVKCAAPALWAYDTSIVAYNY